MRFRPTPQGHRRGERRGALIVLAALAASLPASLRAQDPDSLRVLPDTLRPGVTVTPLDSGTVVDTVYTTHPDSVFRPLPALSAGAPARLEAGVTLWDREALLGTPAITLLELLAREPDLLPLRFGDYGAPEAVLGPGLAGGRVRVFVDGLEEVPLDGAVPDLGRVSLAGIDEVRAERGGGELRIHLTSLRPTDPRPLSRVDAGTGDLNTNLFRGTFLHPRALGGTLGLSMEREDTEGRGGQEPGSRQAVWFRWALHSGDDFALAFDVRKSTAEFAVGDIPPSRGLTSWAVRARARLAPSLVAEAYSGSLSLSADDDGLTPLDTRRRQHGVRLSWDRAFGAAARDTTSPAPAVSAPSTGPDSTAPAAARPDSTGALPPDTAGALPPDSTGAPPVLPADSATVPQDSATVAPAAGAPAPVTDPTPAAAVPQALPQPATGGLSGRLWSLAEGRLHTGGDLPSRSLAFEAGFDVEGIGGVAGEFRSDLWSDPVREETATVQGVRAWTAPVLGLSLFAGWDSGVRGGRIESLRVAIPEPDTTGAEPEPDVNPAFHLSDRTALRAGARLDLGPLDVSGTWYRIDTDSLIPVGLPGMRQGVATPGDEVTGVQVAGRLGLPILVDGLSVVGSLLEWESEGIYRPRRRYTGGLDFHNVYKDGNLELWSSFQVQGRDAMLLPWPQAVDDETLSFVRVPFQQSWDFWVQVRVLTVRIFIRSENVTLRRGNQDFPDRLLPQTRSVYGVRWTLWN